MITEIIAVVGGEYDQGILIQALCRMKSNN